MHERRAPALLTNLSQALLMAPLFSVLVCALPHSFPAVLSNLPALDRKLSRRPLCAGAQEALFVLGWAPALRREVLASAKERIAGFDAAAKAKSKAKAG